MPEIKPAPESGENAVSSETAFERYLNSTEGKFALLNRIILRDLNKTNLYVPLFTKFSKDDITRFLANPYQFEKQLRDAVIYIYGASSHFRRLIQYFVGLTDLAYIIEPYNIDPQTASARIVGNNYRKTLKVLSSMNLKTQLPPIITVCFREDVFYGTFWPTDKGVTIMRLPSDYCAITSVQDNVLSPSFNFRYFDTRPGIIDYYPEEFRIKYTDYVRSNRLSPWRELDVPNSFAIKCNTDILNYAIPPFAGLLREIYDIEDYKKLKLTKTAIENYAMIAMQIPTNDDGTWKIDGVKAKEFWTNLSAVVPEEIGTILTPMELEKISFERSNVGDTNTIADAEQNLYTAAGVSSLLFNNSRASANALLLSIKADQAMTYGVVKSIGDAINRYIQAQTYGKNFRVNFLDCSTYNRKELGEMYLKAASYGLPTISMYAASQGLGQEQLDSMSFLEGTVLDLPSMFHPLVNSAQMSVSESEGATDEGGAPTKDIGELTDSGEQTAEDRDDWG